MLRELVLHTGPTRCYIEYGALDASYRYFLEADLRDFCRRNLTSWKTNPRTKETELNAEYFVKDVEHGTWYFPSPFKFVIKDFLIGRGYTVVVKNIPAVVPRAKTYRMGDGIAPRDDLQRRAIKFLTSNHKERCGLEVQTGGGKTFCSIHTAHDLGEVVLIVVEGLIGQWVDEIKRFTNIDDDKIFVIQGNESIHELLESERKPEVFVASLATMRSYVKREDHYKDCIPYDRFVDKYGIGIKVVDEAHKNVHATSLIDMAGDIQTNIYLTATFLTGDRSLRKIFHTYFPNQMRYGEEYDRYCEVFGYNYRGMIPARKTMMFGVYQHGRLEKQMLWSKRRVFNIFMQRYLIPLIEKHYVEKEYEGKKILIYFALKKTIREVQKYLQAHYPQFRVLTYIDKDPRSNLEDGDIIISTHKGAGTGTDVKNLVTLINTVSYVAETTTRQLLGRLRKLPEHTPTYVDLYDMANYIHVRHWRVRSGILRQCAKLFREYQL